MAEEYTKEVLNNIFGLLESDTAQIEADMAQLSETASADLWKKELTKIAQDYSFSSRFALMRIIYNRARASGLVDAKAPEIPTATSKFKVTISGKTLEFQDFSLAHAETLTRKECNQYVTYLMSQAALQEDSDSEIDEYLISRAWYGAKRGLFTPQAFTLDENDAEKHKVPLTREEALYLGHTLQFSLNEMQWYLLRVFDFDDGLRFNKANDLIEAYGFMTNASWLHVRELKKKYTKICNSIEKDENQVPYFEHTSALLESLPMKFGEWKHFPETMDQNFLEWMRALSPRLDIPSRTATRIYRNLAAYALDLADGKELTPEDDDFVDQLQSISKDTEESQSTHRLLYKNGIISPEYCSKAAKKLLFENKLISDSIQDDSSKAWHVPTTLSNGKPTPTGEINSCRTQVEDILAGRTQAEKSDMLYLLWFTFNIVWQGADKPDANAICCRILNFKDAAEDVLKEALLPTFYPPHLMEQTMLLSIVNGGKSDIEPSAVYEYALESLRITGRVRTSKESNT